MSLSSISIRPGGRSLAAYHQERASLYGAILALLDEDTDELELADVRRRLARVRSSQHRARTIIEQVLHDEHLHDQRDHWLRMGSTRSPGDLETLAGIARQAAQCARALWEGDMAAAADLWDAQSQAVCGVDGQELSAFADELLTLELSAYVSIGRALRLLLEDDATLAGLAS